MPRILEVVWINGMQISEHGRLDIFSSLLLANTRCLFNREVPATLITGYFKACYAATIFCQYTLRGIPFVAEQLHVEQKLTLVIPLRYANGILR